VSSLFPQQNDVLSLYLLGITLLLGASRWQSLSLPIGADGDFLPLECLRELCYKGESYHSTFHPFTPLPV
jgi:hypothetical protein